METKIDIKGIDLKIDSTVQDICETSNKTSGTTRSVLYVMLIISIVVLIGVVNTLNNWYGDRLSATWSEIHHLEDEICALKNIGDTTSCKYVFYQDSLKLLMGTLINLNRTSIEYYTTMRIPVLGNAFDIDNLALISGVSFWIVLVILFFTLTREKNNLKIAIRAVSERYSGESEKDLFLPTLDNFKSSDNPEIEILKQINRTRREYHYNYLSMNEVFTLPLLKLSKTTPKLRDKLIGKAVMKISWVSFCVYFLIFINDIITINYALKINPLRTIFSVSFESVFLIVIGYYSFRCSEVKDEILEIYDIAYKNDFTYPPSVEQTPEWEK